MRDDLTVGANEHTGGSATALHRRRPGPGAGDGLLAGDARPCRRPFREVTLFSGPLDAPW